MAGQTIQISVLADTKKFSSAMRGLSQETGLSKLGAGFAALGKAAAVGLAAAAAGLTALGVKAVGAAGELEQSIGAVDTVFKDSAGQIHEWAKGAAEAAGLTRNQYNELGTLIGTQLKNGGTAMDELGPKTNNLITLGADLASMFGGTTADAVGALSSALKGERDPIEKFGVSLNQAAIDAKAAEMGFEKVGGALSAEANQAATLALIMDQTADAHGNFAKESNTLAGQQERLKAKLGNITATLGMYLLPILTAVTAWVSDRLGPAFEALTAWIETSAVPALQSLGGWLRDNVLPALQDLATWVQGTVVPALQAMGEWITGTLVPGLMDAGTWINNNKDWLAALAVTVGTMVVAYQGYVQVMAIWKAATVAAQAVQVAFNAVMAANPIGLIVLAIAGLVAGLVYFFTQTETGKAIVETAWAAIQGAVEAVKTWFTDTLVPALSAAWDTITSGLSTFATWLSDTWTSIKNTATDKWNGVLDFFRGIPGKVTDFFMNWTLLGLLIQHWDSIKTTATEKWNALVDWVKGIPQRFVDGLAAIANIAIQIGIWVLGIKDAAVEKFMQLVDWVKELPGKILSGLGDLSRLLINAGKNIIEGLWNGLKAKWEAVKDWVGGIADWIADNKGPKAYDLNLLVNAGKWIMQGLQDGLRSEIPNLRRTLEGVSAEVARTPMAPLQVGTSASSTSASRWGAAGSNTNPAMDGGHTTAPLDLSEKSIRGIADAVLAGAGAVGTASAREQLNHARRGVRR
ncbi:hypothetical protein FE374_09390 [Georgenia yuyongxinii]|uniref:Tape measure protein n=1 Tax=Georgenia yuyongxinii TaxID=2589797 RepID=A0A5B8C3F7_9MICO|nr:hypothetical protein [Georgenia yuyongxinii]QDC24798.1 hypothetical protein FE374_09390 [Georgenia yuyongxinii]